MLFEYGEALIRFKFWQYWYLNIHTLKMYFSRLLTIGHISMAASDNILREKEFALFRKILACIRVNTKLWKYFQTIYSKLSVG